MGERRGSWTRQVGLVHQKKQATYLLQSESAITHTATLIIIIIIIIIILIINGFV